MTALSRIRANPFYQPLGQWQILVPLAPAQIGWAEAALADLALSCSSFEVDEAREHWCVAVITETEPVAHDIQARLALAFGLRGAATPAFEIQPLLAKDWVSEVERSFPPFSVGRFYVHGSHAMAAPPAAQLALHVNAGAAFGSGEHATTSGCLLALSLLARKRRFHDILDIGCGSGILAIAAAKLWHRPVLATDIDPVSVRVARENAARNQMQQWVRTAQGDGYQCNTLKARAPFDLILANILARPLTQMAPSLAASLAPGGIAVLSGLLVRQERLVLAAHRAQGLRLLARLPKGDWQTLILAK